MRVHTQFYGGKVHIVSQNKRTSCIELTIDEDSGGLFRQWFSFRVEGAKRRRLQIDLLNAADCTYADAFQNYQLCATYDGEFWFRVETEFDGDVLSVFHTPAKDEVTYAYFAQYTEKRREKFRKRCMKYSHVQSVLVSETVCGTPLNTIIFGDPDARQSVWVIARQHSGETMAEWMAEGLMQRLCRTDDLVVRSLLEEMCFYVVPCVNPDGARLGNQRTNAAGLDLNRQWEAPQDEANEVIGLREMMDTTGVQLFVDCHGDERIPYCFLAGCEGNPSWSADKEAQLTMFTNALIESAADFEGKEGYERDEPGQADLSAAANWVGEEFDCLSVTFEMPFTDVDTNPAPPRGFSPERAQRLGHDLLEAILLAREALE